MTRQIEIELDTYFNNLWLFRMVPLSRYVMQNFSYVTAASENHFLGLRKAVYTLRKNCCPHQEIIIYDIGLSQNSSTEVENERLIHL